MHVSLRIKGYLDPSWQEWFSGMQISPEPGGISLLTGPLPDQAALFGVLLKIRNLNLHLLAVTVIDEEDAPEM